MQSQCSFETICAQMHGTKEVDVLERTITPKSVTPQKQKITKLMDKSNFPALETHYNVTMDFQITTESTY